MRKIIIASILWCGFTCKGFCQNTSANLFLLGKVWGFLKYFHPTIAEGKVDWDSALLHFLPVYRRISNVTERDDSLVAWIDRLGDIGNADSPISSLHARLQPDFAWMEDTRLSASLRTRLRGVLLHRNTKDGYYIRFESAQGLHFPVFQHEKAYASFAYPDTAFGLLCLFRFWNTIEYWYPYKYHLRMSWDDVLRTFIPRMTREETLRQFVQDTEELLCSIDDSHGFINWTADAVLRGAYRLPFTVKSVGGRWLVTSLLRDSLAAGIQPGDLLDSVDGRSAVAIALELSATCPASNEASRLYKLSSAIIQTRQHQSQVILTRGESRVAVTTTNFKPNPFTYLDANPPFFPYPRDSAFCLLPDHIGYINMGRLNRKDSLRCKAMIRQTRGLIIDDRQNADEVNGTGAVDVIGNMLVPPSTPVARFSSLQPSLPGLFILTDPTNDGIVGSPDYYRGKVAVLIDEGAMSVGEFMSMIFTANPHARLIGSHTAGADGGVAIQYLPGGIAYQFTALGVYYPNGGETQRIGIQPNIKVIPTLDDYLHHRDAVLERAIAWIKGVYGAGK